MLSLQSQCHIHWASWPRLNRKDMQRTILNEKLKVPRTNLVPRLFYSLRANVKTGLACLLSKLKIKSCLLTNGLFLRLILKDPKLELSMKGPSLMVETKVYEETTMLNATIEVISCKTMASNPSIVFHSSYFNCRGFGLWELDTI